MSANPNFDRASYDSGLTAGQIQLSATQKKLEAAEARIKASQEQEPFGFLDVTKRMPDFHFKRSSHEDMMPVFISPVIPPDVAELQRQVEFWKNSSREWKLAYVALGGTASDSGKAELTKLLAEANSKAVLEDTVRLDWLDKNKESVYTVWHEELCPRTDGTNTRDRKQVFDGWSCGVLADEAETVRAAIDKAMLAAAPQPDKTHDERIDEFWNRINSMVSEAIHKEIK